MKFAIPKYHESFLDTPVRQTQWADGQGLLFITAIFLGGVGSAAYILGVILDLMPIMVVGWLLAVVGKGGFHFLFLGRPMRVWRALAKVRTSWLSRGLWGLGIFSVIGLVYIGLEVTGSVNAGLRQVLAGLSLLAAVFVMVYEAFLLKKAVGIPVWNTWWVLALIPTFSLLAGSALVMLIQLALIEGGGFTPEQQPAAQDTIKILESLTEILLVAGAIVMSAYLWRGVRQSGAVRISVQLLLHGSLRAWFWIGIVLFVIFFPALAGVAGGFGHLPTGLLALIAGLAVMGEFAVKYTLLASGSYPKMFPAKSLHRLPSRSC
jgi:formate-dependent nitrite reductase membrane component NrfD